MTSALPRRLATALASIAAATTVAACSASHSEAGPAPQTAPAAPATPAFGGFPTFLPKDTVDGGALHQIKDGTAASPVLATQGDTVRVHAGAASVLATLVGPEVPTEGLPKQLDTSIATWTLTFTGATGSVPLAASAFNAVDEDGRIYKLAVVPGSAVPAAVGPGQTVSFKLRATVEVGEGRLRWIPTGHLAPVEWDYTVETD